MTDQQKQVYLVYQYEQFFDSARHLVRIFSDLESAKSYSERVSLLRFEYIKKHPERYESGESAYVSRWSIDDDEDPPELRYEYGQEDSVTLTGEWIGGWGRYAVVTYPIDLES